MTAIDFYDRMSYNIHDVYFIVEDSEMFLYIKEIDVDNPAEFNVITLGTDKKQDVQSQKQKMTAQSSAVSFGDRT